MPTFGPGTLQIGEVGSEIDASCLVNSLRITASKDEGDSVTKLCGSVTPGKITYAYSMSGNIDTDTDTGNGLFALSQATPGAEVPFTFTPNAPTETTATGSLIIDPMDFGADEFGDTMNSDVEWTLVGAPSYTYPDETPDVLDAQPFARVVQNGTPGAGATADTTAAGTPSTRSTSTSSTSTSSTTSSTGSTSSKKGAA